MRLGVEVSQAVRTDGYEIYSGWKLSILSKPMGLTPPVARERERDGGRKGREEGRETLNMCCVVVCLVLNKDKRTNKAIKRANPWSTPPLVLQLLASARFDPCGAELRSCTQSPPRSASASAQ